MDTKVYNVEETGRCQEIFMEAGRVIRSGGLVAFPTETVYGLGGNALDARASEKIYAAKGRPSDNPLIVHIADLEELPDLVAEIPPMAETLMNQYWPGPLTLIFKKSLKVPPETTGGLDTVAVRMPDHEAAAMLIRASGVPIAAPSANTSGRPSPTRAKHVQEDLSGKVDMILDGGEVGIGLESTIIDVTGSDPVILRPGYVSLDMVKKLFEGVRMDKACTEPLKEGERPKAPGMKYRHYAPKAGLTIVEGGRAEVSSFINNHIQEESLAGNKVGVLCTEETAGCYPGGICKCMGRRADEETVAHNLFAALREFDEEEVSQIYSESFYGGQLGQAIMNRLMKAAGYHLIQV
ncbi:L-threonylcarbamoyladenylate synthase [Lachnotalea sp. AF33-28]|uniref:L-threonylcarbamoyladenylate synthase n=1 Tax=Lachnotalea sp. AF33-28 TaxID=2292046 RepID=UPI000E46D093|nr:L-threonylcarbamoyladenylate synthase [Lachnotalea sp. AF33-28]RHP36541.1 threonylcarbamoyl-AMP synthase [Lachnotalea sp. AF33-28]